MKFSPSKFLRSKRGMAAIVALLLVLFLFRPGVYQLRNRIARSIGSALGRRVEIDSVRLRMLPRPGFDLEGLVIYDDPIFSAEPMIRAQEVSAAIRLRSLFRGRLEIATLSANEPSINLVRNDQGRWNLASLIERNAQIPAAPTGKAPSERRPAFPYLEAGHARVNFKIGQTKKSYALMDADVALWQDSENSWGARIQAEPVRTDFNLTDTGLVQINATWQRAPSLRLTPLQIAVQWRNGQLGQISKLLSGNDRGWRGGVNFTARLSGTPEALRIESQTAIEDFHRYDIVNSENVRLAAGCLGEYNVSTSTFADLRCESPVGGGFLLLRGTLSLAAQAPNYDLTLAVEKLPLASLVRLLRQAKKQIPSDLTASGLLNAEFHVRQNVPNAGNVADASEPARRGSSPQWTGTGSATNVRLSSTAENGEHAIAFATIPLDLIAARPPESTPFSQKKKDNDQPVATHLRIGPVAISMNTSAPVNAGGWLSAAGYRFFLAGDMELKDLFRLENVLALPVTRPAAEGEAKLDVSVSGPWQAFAAPVAMGTAQLRNVRAAMRGLNTPIEISSAAMTLTPDTVLIQKISAHTGNTHWSGGVAASRHCAAPNAAPDTLPICVFQFDLTADQLSTADFAEWFTPHPAKRPWYRILNSSSNFNDALGPSPLLAIQAHGNLHVGQFELNNVLVTQVATQLELGRGKITLTSLRAQLMQGTHEGNWTIDLSNRDLSNRDLTNHDLSNHDLTNHDPTNRDLSKPNVATQPAPIGDVAATVRFHGAGTLHDIALAQVGTLMNDAWIAGTADGNFEVDGSGDSFRGLLARSDGKLQFVMRNGSLPHIEIPGSPAPLPVHRFTGDLRLKKGIWELSAGKLQSRDGFYQVKGTDSPGSGLAFVLTRGDEQSWKLTGTLAKPRVEPADGSEAKRTEAAAKTVKP